MRENSGAAWSRMMRPVSTAFILALWGCAPAPAPESMHSVALAADQPEPGTCRPDRALLAPQPAPDCAFRRSDLKTLDPDLWARMKIEYERECYQNAEKIVRRRLRLLQAANACEAAPSGRL